MTQITINNHEVTVVEYKGQRVITFKMMDELHGRPEGTARKRFNDNKTRLTEGEDYWEISHPSEIRTLGLQRPDGSTPAKVIILTEAGYSMLVKSFTDDLAWQVQKALVRSYFKQPVAIANETPEMLAFRAITALQGKLEVMEEQAKLQKAMLEVAQPKADALDKLATLDGLHNLRSAAQQCGWPEQKFIQKLQEIGWIYTHTVTGRKLAYGEKIKAGLMDVKNVQVKRSAGMQAVGQPMITQAGLAKLRTIIGPFAPTPAKAA